MEKLHCLAMRPYLGNGFGLFRFDPPFSTSSERPSKFCQTAWSQLEKVKVKAATIKTKPINFLTLELLNEKHDYNRLSKFCQSARSD